MKSQWFELKARAIRLRRKGHSIRLIESKLKIPRSTLSGWFKNVSLSKEQQAVLRKKWLKALQKARQKAILWHNAQKASRIAQAAQEANSTFKKLNLEDKNLLELALAMLYLGEGDKTVDTSMGNSDPQILRFFLSALKQVYNVQNLQVRCELHLRADQDPLKIKRYWSQQLEVPISRFTTVSIDRRTEGKATYPNYKGVCLVRCGSVAMQRRLMALSKIFCEEVIKKHGRLAQ